MVMVWAMVEAECGTSRPSTFRGEKGKGTVVLSASVSQPLKRNLFPNP